MSLLKTSMNLQYATSIYVMLTYLTYLCKPERQISELMKKAPKKACNENEKKKNHKMFWCCKGLDDNLK